MVNRHDHYEVTVLTQNVLLDKTLADSGRILDQRDRIESAAATLLSYPGSLDIVGVQEAHDDNGQRLAELCGYGPGFWYQHNAPQKNPKRGRRGEYMGMFGALVEYVEPIDIGDSRTALLTVVDEIAYVNFHLRSGKSRWAQAIRAEQAEAIIESVSEYGDAVVFGDGNEPDIPWIARGRSAFGHAGFESAFRLAGNIGTKTFPTEAYKGVRRVPRMRLDEIYVRGDRIQVLGAGVVKQVVLPHPDLEVSSTVPLAPTDHETGYTKLAVAP